MYFLWSYWLPLYLLVVYVSISTSSSNSTHLSLSLLMFIVSDGLSILPFWRNLCSSLQSVQTVQIALSTWGVTITPALLLAILLKISITLTWAGYPVSWVPGSPPLWFILSISWSTSLLVLGEMMHGNLSFWDPPYMKIFSPSHLTGGLGIDF